jgi:SPP1 family predicted phage head-tail adaptor
MNPGELDRLVTVQQVTPTKNAEGFPVETWSDLTRVWAKKEDRGGRQFTAVAQGIAAESDTLFTIRYLSAVTPQHRISFNAKIYDILSVSEVGRNAYMLLACKARVVP